MTSPDRSLLTAAAWFACVSAITAVLVLLLASSPASAQPSSSGGCYEPDIVGNLWDDREVNSYDAMYLLREVANLPLPRAIGGCGPHDIDCDHDVDAVDAMIILRHVAGLPYVQMAGCPAVGDEL